MRSSAAGGAHAVTDVTGYGLAVHASEMADGSRLTLEIDLRSLPIIEGAEGLAIPRFFTRGAASPTANSSGVALLIEPTPTPSDSNSPSMPRRRADS